MSTATINAERRQPDHTDAARPDPKRPWSINRITAFFHRLTSLSKSVVAALTTVAASVATIAGIFNINPAVPLYVSEYFNGTNAEWSEQTDVKLKTSKNVPRLTVKSCHTGSNPRKTTHLAYVHLQDNGGLSHIEPFVMLRDKCDTPHTVWINDDDYQQLSRRVDQSESASPQVISVTFSRVDLDRLDELLGNTDQLDNGEARS